MKLKTMLNIYGLWDTERCVMSPPYQAEDDIVAKRIFIKSLAKSPFWKSCELYWIGKFDEKNIDNPIETGTPNKIPVDDTEMQNYWNEYDRLNK